MIEIRTVDISTRRIVLQVPATRSRMPLKFSQSFPRKERVYLVVPVNAVDGRFPLISAEL